MCYIYSSVGWNVGLQRWFATSLWWGLWWGGGCSLIVARYLQFRSYTLSHWGRHTVLLDVLLMVLLMAILASGVSPQVSHP